MWLVSREMPGQLYEEKLAGGGNAGLLGNNGAYMVRAINPQWGYVPNSVRPESFKFHVERLVIKDQLSVDYWLDGKFVGNVPFQSPELNALFKNTEVIGVTSNSDVWDFAAQYYKIGLFNDADATAIFSTLKAKWNTETYPNQICIDNISWTKDATKFTPSAKVIYAPAGITVADPSQWDYQWYQDDGTLGKQVLFATGYQPAISTFTSAKGIKIKVIVRPKDINGKVWRYFEGTYN